MKRRLLNLLTWLPVVLFVGVAALWLSGRIDGQGDGWQWVKREPVGDGQSERLGVWNFVVDGRTVALTHIEVLTTPATADGMWGGRTHSVLYRNLGPGLHRFAGGGFALRVPVWLVLGITAAPAAARYARWRVERLVVWRRQFDSTKDD